jgi:preprotein translocase subunit SecE
MSEVTESKTSFLDIIKWLVVAGIIAAMVWGNHAYAEEIAPAYRILAMLGAALVAVLVFLTTRQGREFRKFAHEARIEIRKVVWPNRKETVNTTMIVMAFTVVMALLLWGVDALLVVTVEWIMGL